MKVSKVLTIFIIIFISRSFEINPNWDFHLTGRPVCRPKDTIGCETVSVQLFVEYSSRTYPKHIIRCNTTYTYRSFFATATIETNVIFVKYIYQKNTSIFFTRYVPRNCVYQRWDQGYAKYYCNVTGLEPKE
uniref:S-protein homolog n=1 Tax=Strongyloides papillosus TaxID=174720 RepID=A0A0N5BDU3_STREA